MTRSVPSWLLGLLLSVLISLSNVNAYPNFSEDKDDHQRKFEDSLRASFRLEETHLDDHVSREGALQKIQEIFGIRNTSESLAPHEVPQFMMELYNTVTESSMQSQKPYNAKVVRSFIEKDTSLPNFYFFNVSSLEINELMLRAELHLYQKKTSLESFPLNPYLIKLYQVLEDHSLDTPDLHKLLDVYSGTQASGWQVFNVTEAVFGWLSGEPNLGLLVTASDLLENKISIEFFRRNDYHYNKQPILVLFDDVSNKPSYYAYGNRDNEKKEKSEEEEKEKTEEDKNLEDYDSKRLKRLRKNGQPEEAVLPSRFMPTFFTRQKRRRCRNKVGENRRRGGRRCRIWETMEQNEPANYDSQDRKSPMLLLEETTRRRRRDVALPKERTAGIVSKNHTKKISKVLTSMDIYERAKFREQVGQVARKKSVRKQRRSADNQNTIEIQSNTTETCTRHELYVDFEEIGLSSTIIAPPGYLAYQCKGVCESPLSQDQWPTNHATIQAIMHKVGLVKGVEKPCCVPIKLRGITILFLENNENVVLKNYDDMVAERCGCR